jgi:hypothetical protein
LTLGAAAVHAAGSVAGTWLVSVTTQAGNGDVTFVLEQDGDTISGTYKGSFGEQKVSGKVDGDAFELSFTADAMGSPLDVKYTGKIEADKISGKVALGTLGEGTFSGTKKE